EDPQLLGGGALALVGFDLLERQLPLPQLLEQRFDLGISFARIGLADQHVDALDVELAEALPQRFASLVLNLVALMQELEHRLLVRYVAEEGREHRVERLRDEPLDVSEALNDARRSLIVDMYDH